MKHITEAELPRGDLGLVDRVIRFCLMNRLVVVVLVGLAVVWGLVTAPFDFGIPGLPRDPVPVDAIPDLGENQQIVFTEWMGRSPRDVEDQVTYPLSSALLGVPGVRSVRSYSFLGFSTVYLIFNEDVDFYWSRSRILEKLSSLPEGTLPASVSPSLGPDATGLGQIFWYTLEGRDPDGRPIGGWDLHELRSIQDWQVRYALLGASGVSEVASIGGFVKEYQVDADPDAMRAHGVSLGDVEGAIQGSNLDVGARTIEQNQVEYVVRGLGFLEGVEDIEDAVVRSAEGVPLRVGEVATVQAGPAWRRGVLDREGAEAVGGVVVARHGANPQAVIDGVKAHMAQAAPGLPVRAVVDFGRVSREAVERFAADRGFAAWREGGLDQAAWTGWLAKHPRETWPDWVTTSRVTVVPFYDRSVLIGETLGTLEEAITLQVLITVIVVVVMVGHLRSSLLIGLTLPLAVLVTFIAMRYTGVDANIVALSGIAIAIGTVVDMGIIVSENILRHLGRRREEPMVHTVFRASREVGGAVVTAVATTIISFLPVFTMTAAEGKLFKPLAFTKTYALAAAALLAITVLPVLASLIMTRVRRERGGPLRRHGGRALSLLAAVLATVLLARAWAPLGPAAGPAGNLAFVAASVFGLLGFFRGFQWCYPAVLRWCLRHKGLYLCIPGAIVVFGLSAWLGWDRTAGWMPEPVREGRLYALAEKALPGFGSEFMPSLDEGAFLFMPTMMPHAALSEAVEMLAFQDKAIAAIPEVDRVVGKVGRVDSALDPAPVSMVETVINYKPEYITGADGRRLRFKYDRETGAFPRDAAGELIPDRRGRPFRQWRDHIRNPDDLWKEIVDAAAIPGMTTAPKLQPIETRIIMLQSGIRAPFGVKVRGPDLETIEAVGKDIERLLKELPEVNAGSVLADRIVGKPYLEIDIDREAIARYGLRVTDVQDVIEAAVGGKTVTQTVEGRERYAVRLRYPRELRDRADALDRIVVPTSAGAQVPLGQLADVRYVRGPQAIKSEDGFLVGYVVFDRNPDWSEVEVVEACRKQLEEAAASGQWRVPEGVSYAFTGNWENVVRSQRTLALVIPLALAVIFLILYLQFRAVLTTTMVFSAIAVAWAGGFLLMWLYGQPWFLDITLGGVNLRDLFQVGEVNMSVAIWVGFLALFGIATDDGVVIASYLDQSFREHRPTTRKGVRDATVRAGRRRIRPCLMTTATTLLALLPVLTSTGRGSDVMVPMAIPAFGGMLIALLTLFLVPVLYALREELRLGLTRAGGGKETT